jgi:hypothetical protein
MNGNNQLVIPAEATRDTQAVEVLRVWLANGQQYVSLRTGVWGDPAAWGIMLADLARHVANSYHQSSGLDTIASLRRIRQGFEVELTSPTDQPAGHSI